MTIEELAELLHETSVHHDAYEKSHAQHNWWDWYAAYLKACLDGADSAAAVQAADAYMDDVLHVPAA
ncbi:MAG: bleomycin resistance protein [Solirubrobacteraceae bacterium]